MNNQPFLEPESEEAILRRKHASERERGVRASAVPLQNDADFLTSLGISPEPLRAIAGRLDPAAKSDSAGRPYAEDLFSRSEFARFFDVLWAYDRCARLRVTANAPTFGKLALFPGREIEVCLATCRPDPNSLLLYAAKGEARIARFDETGRNEASLPVKDPLSHQIVDGFVIIDVVGPEAVPQLEIGESLELTYGINRWTESVILEKKTSRAYHFRVVGKRRMWRVTFREFRSGHFRVVRSHAPAH